MAGNQTQLSELEREDFTRMFVDLLKICRPKHPYLDNPYEDITEDNIERGWCCRTSNYYARCGPRRTNGNVAFLAVDKRYFQSRSIERDLACFIHELTHIPYASNYNQPTHPPEFWNEMAFHAQVFLDNISRFEDSWFTVDAENFKESVIDDPNSAMVDRRQEKPSEVKSRFREWLGDYPVNTPESATRR